MDTVSTQLPDLGDATKLSTLTVTEPELMTLEFAIGFVLGALDNAPPELKAEFDPLSAHYGQHLKGLQTKFDSTE